MNGIFAVPGIDRACCDETITMEMGGAENAFIALAIPYSKITIRRSNDGIINPCAVHVFKQNGFGKIVFAINTERAIAVDGQRTISHR